MKRPVRWGLLPNAIAKLFSFDPLAEVARADGRDKEIDLTIC